MKNRILSGGSRYAYYSIFCLVKLVLALLIVIEFYSYSSNTEEIILGGLIIFYCNLRFKLSSLSIFHQVVTIGLNDDIVFIKDSLNRLNGGSATEEELEEREELDAGVEIARENAGEDQIVYYISSVYYALLTLIGIVLVLGAVF